jgi:hypothetical protein
VPDNVTVPFFTVITTPGAAARIFDSRECSISLSVGPCLHAASNTIKQKRKTRIGDIIFQITEKIIPYGTR